MLEKDGVPANKSGVGVEALNVAQREMILRRLRP